MAACIFVYNDSRCRRMRKERVGIKRNLHSALRFRDCRQTWTWSSVADNRTIHLHNERHSGGWADCRAAPPLRAGSAVPAVGGIRFRLTDRLEHGSHIVAIARRLHGAGSGADCRMHHPRHRHRP